MGNRGGPPGNKKAVTTGEYKAIWLGALQPDEQVLITQRRVLWELKEIKDAVPVREDKSGVTKILYRTELVESQIEEKEYRKFDDIIRIE
ncbi:hypothetical protein [Paenibacillus tyrfis]|uniref:Head-tail adaptor protein n=1 Tax=Paenibacillus tyrfis TaxID=1501230 RepID=A0A081PAQ8_9BACL|nr:hypothetical protein [Paenibacillus tyrfis]KEQ27781.1 hypothetical protein ET33_13995 [Paenibacillus tyrfis]